MLLKANHKDNRVIIGNTIVNLKRGQFITSQVKLAKEWRWSRYKVQSFLDTLVACNMIEVLPTRRYTVITIVNYDKFQSTNEDFAKDLKKTSTKKASEQATELPARQAKIEGAEAPKKHQKSIKKAQTRMIRMKRIYIIPPPPIIPLLQRMGINGEWWRILKLVLSWSVKHLLLTV